MVTWNRQILLKKNRNAKTHPNITFPYEASTALSFLDVLIKMSSDNAIYTTVYGKLADRHSYLH